MSSQTTSHVINGTLEAVTTVIPMPLAPQSPALISGPLLQPEMGVLIGITGDIRGRLLLEGKAATFGSIGETMFGMALEGSMLESFTGELGNMIAGNLCTNVAARGIKMDITPPTVLVGQTKLHGFDKALQVPVSIEGTGEFNLILILEEQSPAA